VAASQAADGTQQLRSNRRCNRSSTASASAQARAASGRHRRTLLSPDRAAATAIYCPPVNGFPTPAPGAGRSVRHRWAGAASPPRRHSPSSALPAGAAARRELEHSNYDPRFPGPGAAEPRSAGARPLEPCQPHALGPTPACAKGDTASHNPPEWLGLRITADIRIREFPPPGSGPHTYTDASIGSIVADHRLISPPDTPPDTTSIYEQSQLLALCFGGK